MEYESLYGDYESLLVEISQLFIKARAVAAMASDVTSIKKIDEAESVVSATVILLKVADPLLIPASRKDNIANYLSEIKRYLEDSVADKQIHPEHLNIVQANIESLKPELPLLVPRPDDRGVEALRETVVKARRSASQHLRMLSEELSKSLTELRVSFAAETQITEETFNEKHAAINLTYEKRLTVFEAEVNEKLDAFEKDLAVSLSEVSALKELSDETTDNINLQKDRLDKAIAEFQKQFSERIGEFQRQFSEAEEDRRKRLETSINSRERAYSKESKGRTDQLNTWQAEFTKQFDDQRTFFENTSSELIKQIQAYAQEAKVTVGLMSEKSLQNDFIIQAEQEKGRARWWNAATFGMVVLLLVAIGYIFVHTFISPLPADSSGYTQILSKFLVTAVIGVIARWTSRQANRHLAEERRLRRLALELATINPFLSNLPDDIQFKVKEVLAMRYYGNNSEEKAPFGEVTPIHDGDGGIKSIPEAILDNLRGKQ